MTGADNSCVRRILAIVRVLAIGRRSNSSPGQAPHLLPLHPVPSLQDWQPWRAAPAWPCLLPHLLAAPAGWCPHSQSLAGGTALHIAHSSCQNMECEQANRNSYGLSGTYSVSPRAHTACQAGRRCTHHSAAAKHSMSTETFSGPP